MSLTATLLQNWPISFQNRSYTIRLLNDRSLAPLTTSAHAKRSFPQQAFLGLVIPGRSHLTIKWYQEKSWPKKFIELKIHSRHELYLTGNSGTFILKKESTYFHTRSKNLVQCHFNYVVTLCLQLSSNFGKKVICFKS